MLYYKRVCAEIDKPAAANEPAPFIISRTHAALAVLVWLAMHAISGLRLAGSYWSPLVKEQMLLGFQRAGEHNCPMLACNQDTSCHTVLSSA